ncbi:alpha/beta fold hydrolase [Paenibacillus sp. SC116]|uniref:thioesterase II family protein n=1 Tax=Paenibacillus sp. SC116 TaxID=2968986 RepID=UPI00215A743A|nr:alpha/beta fold hydrolase [Paenibacillus sp. SC116]MCR8843302.1 alpha/beta fold hydrolase [Paenibacillus sp. SC116]
MVQPVKLFCLPYAGGSSAIYARWKKYIDAAKIELVPVELAGRGFRTGEPLCDDMDEVVEDVYHAVAGKVGSGPFAFFGYSMGCLVALELAHRILERTGHMPLHMCMAAKKAPHLPGRSNPLHKLLPEQFEKEIIKLGGTPPELFQDTELVSLFVPMLRADLKAVETYQFQPKSNLLTCDFSVLGGSDDNITLEELNGWKQYTEGTCAAHLYEGGHFFLNDHSEALVQHLQQTIENALRGQMLLYQAVSE